MQVDKTSEEERSAWARAKSTGKLTEVDDERDEDQTEGKGEPPQTTRVGHFAATEERKE